MAESSASLAALKRQVARLTLRPGEATDPARISLGLPDIDARIGGGLDRGRLHELVADGDDAAAGAGFAAMLARRIGGPLVWLRVAGEGGGLYPPGLAEVGIDPGIVLSVVAPDPPALLRAAGDVARCAAVGVAVIELWRQPRLVDLTVSRRLTLAAEESGVTPLLLRIAAEPVPSAARTRWGVRAAPSIPLPDGGAGAPGMPAFDLELMRQRGGPAGWRWQVEWDRDAGVFRRSFGGASGIPEGVGDDGGEPGGYTAPLSGDLAALPERRPLHGGGRRRVG